MVRKSEIEIEIDKSLENAEERTIDDFRFSANVFSIPMLNSGNRED